MEDVQCVRCGGEVNLSGSSRREHRLRGTRPTHKRCRRSRVAIAGSAEHRRYWLDRFTLEEIQELAAVIWG